MRVADLVHFEEQCFQSRGWRRGEMCRRLGISQAKWRRHLEPPPFSEVPDRTLGLAMAAIWAGLETYGEVTFSKLEETAYPPTGPTAARVLHVVHFTTWLKDAEDEEA